MFAGLPTRDGGGSIWSEDRLQLFNENFLVEAHIVCEFFYRFVPESLAPLVALRLVAVLRLVELRLRRCIVIQVGWSDQIRSGLGADTL